MTSIDATILIIEDNEANLELMRYLLHAGGYQVRCAMDGLEGLSIIEGHRGEIDVVICDVHLPGIGGLEIAKRVRVQDRLRLLPLVAVSALAMVGDRDAILSAGFDGYIAKPIDPRSFVSRIESYLPQERRSDKDPRLVASKVERSSVGVPAPTATVLLVDDQRTNLEVMKGLLVPSGLAVVTASTGDEAMKILSTWQPDLILADLHLGTEIPFEFIERVKANESLASIPFVFISSTSKKQNLVQHARNVGALRFLFRPLDPQALLEELRQCLEQKQPGGRM